MSSASRGVEHVDPHDLASYEDGSERGAERAATLFVIFSQNPSYAALMYVVHLWRNAGRSLKEWIVCQYATLLRQGDTAQREAALYSLWVDFFEVEERARFVFPRLLKRLPHAAWAELLAHSGPVPWLLKCDAYRDAAARPSLHAGLAEGLHGSFFDVYGSVHAGQARGLLQRIVVEDASIRAELERVTTQPSCWELLAIVTVDQRDASWTRWLPPETTAEQSFLVLLRFASPHQDWIPGAEVVHDGQTVARLMHWGIPFDLNVSHRAYGRWQEREHSNTVVFRAEGHAATARRALGCLVEVWPPGLAPRCG